MHGDAWCGKVQEQDTHKSHDRRDARRAQDARRVPQLAEIIKKKAAKIINCRVCLKFIQIIKFVLTFLFEK